MAGSSRTIGVPAYGEPSIDASIVIPQPNADRHATWQPL